MYKKSNHRHIYTKRHIFSSLLFTQPYQKKSSLLSHIMSELSPHFIAFFIVRGLVYLISPVLDRVCSGKPSIAWHTDDVASEVEKDRGFDLL
jgi:hypothetical protein